MSDTKGKDMKEFLEQSKSQKMEASYDKESAKRAGWAAFVESDALNFFREHALEKLAIEDGNGNKAKLTLTKDEEIKVEYSSITIL